MRITASVTYCRSGAVASAVACGRGSGPRHPTTTVRRIMNREVIQPSNIIMHSCAGMALSTHNFVHTVFVVVALKVVATRGTVCSPNMHGLHRVACVLNIVRASCGVVYF